MRRFFAETSRLLEAMFAADALHRVSRRGLLFVILIVCIAARMWTIGSPALDRTKWKEIDYLEVSQNYWKHGFNFFRPEISWPAEPPRVTAMEFPLVPYLAGVLYAVVGYEAVTARMMTLLAFLLLAVYVYRLGKREYGPVVGLFAAQAACVLPLNHPFGKILYSDPLMLAFSVMALFHSAEWIDHRRVIDWLLAAASLSLAISLKITPLYLLLPIAWIFFRSGWSWTGTFSLATLVAASLLLPLAWFSYAWYLAQTSIDVFGPFGGLLRGNDRYQLTAHDKFQTLSYLGDLGWYQRLLSYRIGWLILGGKAGVGLCVGGLVFALVLKKTGLVLWYMVAVAVSIIMVPAAQDGAPYYQLALVAPLSLFIGLGACVLGTMLTSAFVQCLPWSISQKRAVQLCTLISLGLVLLIPMSRWHEILSRNPLKPAFELEWKMAKVIRQHAKPGDKLVTIGTYNIIKNGVEPSPVLYYYSGLQGWTLLPGDRNLRKIEEFVGKGASIFAAQGLDRELEAVPFIEALKKRYTTLHQDRDCLILDLSGMTLTE